MGDDLFPALEITEACNKTCTACLRPHPKATRKMSREQLSAYRKDLRALSANHRIRYQFVTGGEPTVWKDGSLDIADALGALAQLDFIDVLTVPTNGKVFEKLDVTQELLRRISRLAGRPVVVGLSIAEYQENLDERGSKPLDHLLRVSEEEDVNVLVITLVTLARDDGTSDRLSRQYPHVFQRITPLAPMGRAEQMLSRCPSLCLGSTDKGGLGAFREPFRQDVTAKLKVSDADFDALPNDELLNRLSAFNNCGQSLFIDDRWRYCLPLRHDAAFDLGAIGEMRADAVREFIAERPLLQAIRADGVVDAVRARRDSLSCTARRALDALWDPETTVSPAYRGCMVCKAFYDRGILTELIHERAWQ
ncbi:MAG: radical SAM protein [Deltaproteobacteria bacterium]|jgi:hypothetical protein|nr:radical SAM protein [Deltaproteobacteria bacterium]MBW2537612.1 radical SAM protein [Deltaproteobacteria bacterium]